MSAGSRHEGFELPAPSPADQAKSLALIEPLVERMHEGPIPFAEYMATVLYHPTLGYYGSGQVAFGVGGDFITAPERSRFFTHGLAYEWHQAQAAGLGGEILEIGAGSGRLAIDLLDRLAADEALPARYTILEISPALAERQAENLRASLPPAVAERVRWIDSWSDLGWSGGIVIANEVLDAMPMERFRWWPGKPETAERLLVGFDGQRFVWEERPADEALRATVEAIGARIERPIVTPRETVLAEYNPDLAGWLGEMHASLDAGGETWIYLFDYGSHTADIYRADRDEGTLKCHYRHLAHEDPFVYPGLQDITAWVDFQAVEQAARQAGFAIDGERSQAQWLLGTDVPQRVERELQSRDSLADQARLAQEFRELVMPTEMGERFRVMRLRLDQAEAGASSRR
ncbi:SAM-dependent methyltransferase [Guyparkeria hydrothermalis]|uniref:SAM-dependent methyltransferase n=1 Tax=Guyparkeria halophila TaxID=47960 RepID=A0A6I6CVH4_9GAMM|nr:MULTISPECIES: SAM-dependent methyltransferase [Guyparkeria]MCL7751606.1 SAM-dependent methyltransferase [Guyparkeria hydrothermalis]QGT78069.1 SAM-dependent methyltransferase [Guyparkeria halophila]TKA90458.1 SAM-dependent methyltransferase [Guyparkeria sp. SB14A]